MPVKRSTRLRRRPAPTRDRPAQRRRTRKAIVDATIALMEQGKTPSVNEVAAAAEVSRRTVYLYFPTFDQLLIDATVGALSHGGIERALEADASTDDVERRVEHIVRALSAVTPEVERLGRALIRLTVESGPGPTPHALPRRGYRRIEWIEAAIAPLRAELSPSEFQRLVCALAMVMGWEALIAQRDVCGLTVEQGEELSVWASRALLRAARARQ